MILLFYKMLLLNLNVISVQKVLNFDLNLHINPRGLIVIDFIDKLDVFLIFNSCIRQLFNTSDLNFNTTCIYYCSKLNIL